MKAGFEHWSVAAFSGMEPAGASPNRQRRIEETMP